MSAVTHPTDNHTAMLCICAARVIDTPKRRASSSPACGPAPVTTVPRTMATAVAPAHTHTCRRNERPTR
jgi:hypothetical protein